MSSYTKEYHAEYREKNKEKIKAYNYTKFTCECSGKYFRKNKSAHHKSKKHQDWEKKQNPPVVHVASKPIEEIVQEVVQILKDRGYT